MLFKIMKQLSAVVAASPLASRWFSRRCRHVPIATPVRRSSFGFPRRPTGRGSPTIGEHAGLAAAGTRERISSQRPR